MITNTDCLASYTEIYTWVAFYHPPSASANCLVVARALSSVDQSQVFFHLQTVYLERRDCSLFRVWFRPVKVFDSFWEADFLWFSDWVLFFMVVHRCREWLPNILRHFTTIVWSIFVVYAVKEKNYLQKNDLYIIHVWKVREWDPGCIWCKHFHWWSVAEFMRPTEGFPQPCFLLGSTTQVHSASLEIWTCLHHSTGRTGGITRNRLKRQQR